MKEENYSDKIVIWDINTKITDRMIRVLIEESKQTFINYLQDQIFRDLEPRIIEAKKEILDSIEVSIKNGSLLEQLKNKVSKGILDKIKVEINIKEWHEKENN